MSLPATFTPFNKLEIGGNAFINGKIPIAVRHVPILLIGKGPEPKVWLGLPVEQEVQYLVEDNKPSIPSIRVLQKEGSVSIYFENALVLQTFKKNEDEAIVTHVDLTPLGLTIRADLNSLTVGTNVVSNNTFNGVEIMVTLS